MRLLKDELARERAQRKAAEARTSPTTERIAELDKLLHKYSVKIDGLQAQNKRIARAQGGTKAQRSAKRVAARLFKKKT